MDMLKIPDNAQKLAEGLYRHYVHSDSNGICEAWTRYQSNDLTWVQVAYQTPSGIADATVLMNEAGQVQRFVYHMQMQGQPETTGDYNLEAGALWVRRHFAPNTQLEDRIPYTRTLILDPPFISTKGYTLAALSDGKRHATYAPLLTLSERAGDLAKKSTRYKGTETLTLLDAERSLSHVEYGYDYWVDDANIVWRVLATAHHYEMVLTEYTNY